MEMVPYAGGWDLDVCLVSTTAPADPAAPGPPRPLPALHRALPGVLHGDRGDRGVALEKEGGKEEGR